MKQRALSLIMFAVTLAVCWGATELTYHLLQENIERQIHRSEGITSLSKISRDKLGDIIKSRGAYKTYHRLDPELGWTIRNNAQDGDLYSSNSIGTRGQREYTIDKPESVTHRIATFGDSFTHGDDVSNEDTWQRFMERAKPELEVMNFGVGGYGTDQAWLRYQLHGKNYKPDIVLIGFLVENINRNVNAFVPYYRRLSSPVSKPRFSLNSENKLIFHENMLKTKEDYIQLRENQKSYLKKLGQHDFYYQRLYLNKIGLNPAKLAYYAYINIVDPWVWDHNGQYNPRSEAFRVTYRIMEEFYKEVENQGSQPWIVIFPEVNDVINVRENSLKRYQPLLDALDERGMRFIDIADGFKQNNILSPGVLFRGHYTPRGNELVADIILESLKLKRE